jgi:DNA-binding NarL/FixJ family response regulator
VKVLLATDADWLVQDVVAALGGPDTSFVVCSEGREVAGTIAAKAAAGEPIDVALCDLQIGSMGGMAVTMSLRLDESSGRLPHVPVLMILDRIADVHLAKRSGADGWLVKPLDPLRLRRAVRTVLRGDTYREGLVDGRRGVQPSTAAVASVPDSGAPAEDADVVNAPSR